MRKNHRMDADFLLLFIMMFSILCNINYGAAQKSHDYSGSAPQTSADDARLEETYER